MLSHNDAPPFKNFNFSVDSVFNNPSTSGGQVEPFPPDIFLLLDSNEFLLLDGSNFLLL